MKKVLPWITFVIALGALAAVGSYIQQAIAAQQNQVKQQRPSAPQAALGVTVVEVSTGAHKASIEAVGVAAPRYTLSLTNQVAGEIEKLASAYEVGQLIKKGTTLVALSNPEINANVASAKNSLASAELALKEEQRQVRQAQAEWDAAGLSGQPSSDLVLRKPQLEAAQAAVNAAKASLALALSRQQDLIIKAPFDGILTQTPLAPGQYISANTTIAVLHSADYALVELQLGKQDWQKLPTATQMLDQKWSAQLSAVNGDGNWNGYVAQVSQHIDTSSRLRSLFVRVDKPFEQSTPLLSGGYTQVKLEGKPVTGLWQLPNSALSQKSEIWYIDENSLLASFSASPIFVDQSYIYIEPPTNLATTKQQVLTHPYASYLVGAKVKPILPASINTTKTTTRNGEAK